MRWQSNLQKLMLLTQWSEARHRQTGSSRNKGTLKYSLLICCKEVRLTAAMVAASRSVSLTLWRKKNWHKHQHSSFLSALARHLVHVKSSLRRGNLIRNIFIWKSIYLIQLSTYVYTSADVIGKKLIWKTKSVCCTSPYSEGIFLKDS